MTTNSQNMILKILCVILGILGEGIEGLRFRSFRSFRTIRYSTYTYSGGYGDNTGSTSMSGNDYAIIFGIIGGAVLVTIISIIIGCCVAKRRRSNHPGKVLYVPNVSHISGKPNLAIPPQRNPVSRLSRTGTNNPNFTKRDEAEVKTSNQSH